jgi:uncharacterized RDD family membrane protein YckC
MPIIQIPTAFNIELEFEIAPFHKRLLAYLIDFAILLVFFNAMRYFLYEYLFLEPRYNFAVYILFLSLPMLLYSLLTELWMNGQTIGKKMMNIRVIGLDGNEPTFGQYLLRWITKFFEWPFFIIYVVYDFSKPQFYYLVFTGFLGIAVAIIISVTKWNQRLGDLAAGTVLVSTRSDLGISDTVFMEVKDENYQVRFPEVMRLSDGDINTIKTVLEQTRRTRNEEMCFRVEAKVKEVLSIQSNLPATDFLEKLLEDYNYLATKE